MSVTTFNTAGSPAKSGSDDGSIFKTIFILGGIAVAGHLLYSYVIKPSMGKDKEKQPEQPQK